MSKVGKLFSLAAATALAGCGAQESLADAEIEISAFHKDLNENDLNAIWASSTPAFKATSKREDFDKFMTAVHTKLGDAKITKQVGWQVNATTSGTFVVLQMATQFEKGEGSETFTFLKTGEDLSLQGYNVQSPVLVIN